MALSASATRATEGSDPTVRTRSGNPKRSSRAPAKKKPPAKKRARVKKAPAAPVVAAELRVERKALADLKPMPVNPRVELRPGMPRYENLKRSIERHGFVDPLVWNRRSNHLVGGWQRRSVLLDMGFTEADVSVVDLDPEQERELNILLNGVGGEWDYQALALELQAYDDPTVLGFPAEEIDRIFEEAGLGTGSGSEGGDGFGDLEKELAGLAGSEDYSIVLIVPLEHADEIKTWLANGELDTAAGRGRGVLKRCGLL